MREILIGVAAALGLAAAPAFADETCGTGASSTIFDVTGWTIEPSKDTGSMFPTNRMTETLFYRGSKPIRMVDGSIRFSDVLGESVGSMAIDRDIRLNPGDSYTQEGNWGQNTFERLLQMERVDVVVTACVKAVVYADGTQDQFD